MLAEVFEILGEVSGVLGRRSEEEILGVATSQPDLQKEPDAELAYLNGGIRLFELCRKDPAELGHRPVMSEASR